MRLYTIVRCFCVASALLALASTPARAQFLTPNTAASVGGACTTGQYAWPDSNGLPLKCVSSLWVEEGGSVGNNLGTAVGAASPQVSGDATTGFYTAGAHLVDVAANNSQIAEFSANGLDIINGKLAIGGAFTPTNTISLSGQAARTMWMERETTGSTAGNNLTIIAGGGTSGGTDLAGGNLILSSGASTGTHTSNIQLQVYPAAASTGTADNAQTTAITISETGTVTGGTGSFGNLATLLQTTAASGTDKNGATLTLASGVSTGTGTSSMNFNVYGAGTTGSAANATTTAMTITSAGLIGIGTAAPLAALDILGHDNNNGILRLDASAAGDNAGITFFSLIGQGANSRNWQISTNYNVIGGLEFLNSSNSTGNPTNDVMVINSAGSVGIGTTVPATLLHVRPGTNENLGIFGPVTLSSGVTLGAFNDAISANVPMELRASLFDITGGNVGIGTTAPQSLLQVNGGEVQIGSSGVSCASNNAGALRYAGGALTFCNGSIWTGPSAAAGGSTTDVEFNSGGSLSGDSGFTYAGSGAATLTTSLVDPLVIGGTGASSTLTLESTSGTGTSDSIIFKTGSQSTAMTLTTTQQAGFGTTSPASGSDFEIDTPAGQLGPGTVAVTSGGGTVTGTSTKFVETFQNGDTITANSETHTVTAVASDTSMTTDNWTATASGKTYTIAGGQRVLVQQNGGVIIGGGANNGNGSPRLLTISRAFTNNGGTNAVIGAAATLSLANTSAAFTSAMYGFFGVPEVGASNTQNWTNAFSLVGVAAAPQVLSGATGIITAMTGLYSAPSNNSSGATVSNAYGVQVASIGNSGTMTSAAGIASANISTATNNTQLLLGTTTIPTGNYGIYNSNTNDNYFAGNVGIGTASPAFDANSSKFFAVNNATAHGFSEVGVGGNATTAGDYAGAFEFYNSSLSAADRRIAAIFSGTPSGGATNSGDLELYTYNAGSIVEAMVITPAGNVGIGTAVPWSIASTAAANLDLTSSATARLMLHSTSTTQEDRVTTNGAGLYLDSVGHATAAGNNIIVFRTTNTNSNYTLNERMRIDSAGLVGIGKTPTTNLDVSGSIAASGSITGGTITGSTFNVSGGADYTTDRINFSAGTFYVLNGISVGVNLPNGNTAWGAQSDLRLKDIIEPITGGLTKVEQIRPVIYRFKKDDPGKRRSGIIAQDVQKVLPEVVYTGEDGYLNVAYTELIPLTISAIQDLKAENDKLRAANDNLEARVKVLEAARH